MITLAFCGGGLRASAVVATDLRIGSEPGAREPLLYICWISLSYSSISTWAASVRLPLCVAFLVMAQLWPVTTSAGTLPDVGCFGVGITSQTNLPSICLVSGRPGEDCTVMPKFPSWKVGFLSVFS